MLRITTMLKRQLITKTQNGSSFLSCVSLLQKELNISLIEAKGLLLESTIYTEKQKLRINYFNELSKSEFEVDK